MANNYTICGTYGQIGCGEQFQVSGVNGRRPGTVSLADAIDEYLVLIDIAFANALVLPLGQFVIAKEVMDPVRVLALERRDQVEQLMRLVPPASIAKRTVYHFLKNEMTLRVLPQVHRLEQQAEILHAAMQIAGHHDF